MAYPQDFHLPSDYPFIDGHDNQYLTGHVPWFERLSPRIPPIPHTIASVPPYQYSPEMQMLTDSPQIHWPDVPSSPMPIPGFQYCRTPPNQWQTPLTTPTVCTVVPGLRYGDFNGFLLTHPPNASSPLPLRGEARAPIAYEDYHNGWQDPREPLPHVLYRRRRNTASISSRARTDPLQSIRPKSPRMMPSSPKSRSRRTTSTSMSPAVSHTRIPVASNNQNLNQFFQQSTEEAERYFECDKCPAKFSRKRDKDRHIRSVHTGQTPYFCRGCDAGFVRSDARGRHWKAESECHSKHLLIAAPAAPSPSAD